MNSAEFVRKYFAYDHLPERLQAISKPFAELAQKVRDQGGDVDQMERALWHLLDAKDAAVRAVL